MTTLLQNIRKRLSLRPQEPVYTRILEMETSQYLEWINWKLRKECFFDNFTEVSHWVPYLLAQHPLSKEDQLLHAWSPVNKSSNIYIKEDDPFVLHRQPISLSTDVARGKIGYSSGVHAWKVSWPAGQRGTHAVIGVTTDQSLLHYDSYVSLVGLDAESWGWDLVSMLAVHNTGGQEPTPSRTYPLTVHRTSTEDKFKVPDSIYVILDMEKGSLSFVTGNKFLGVAHTGLAGKTLYPAISAVWGHCEVGLRYFNCISRSPPSLKDLSLFVARKVVKYHCQYSQHHCKIWLAKQVQKVARKVTQRQVVDRLELPQTLKCLLKGHSNLSLVAS